MTWTVNLKNQSKLPGMIIKAEPLPLGNVNVYDGSYRAKEGRNERH